jgi:hypothetical protein
MAIFRNIKRPNQMLWLDYKSLTGWEGWFTPARLLISSFEFSHSLGVTPLVETVCNFHTCCLIDFPSQTVISPSESSAAGEAEASSAGEQLAKDNQPETHRNRWSGEWSAGHSPSMNGYHRDDSPPSA